MYGGAAGAAVLLFIVYRRSQTAATDNGGPILTPSPGLQLPSLPGESSGGPSDSGGDPLASAIETALLAMLTGTGTGTTGSGGTTPAAPGGGTLPTVPIVSPIPVLTTPAPPVIITPPVSTKEQQKIDKQKAKDAAKAAKQAGNPPPSSSGANPATGSGSGSSAISAAVLLNGSNAGNDRSGGAFSPSSIGNGSFAASLTTVSPATIGAPAGFVANPVFASVGGNNAGKGTANADVGYGPGNYATPTGAPSGPAITANQSGGNSGSSNNTGASLGQPASWGPQGPADYIDIGQIGSAALQIASIVTPFPYSLAPTLVGAGLRSYNVANTDQIRQGLGVDPLSVGQIIGAAIGWNDYGNTTGNVKIASGDQNPTKSLGGADVGISTGGLITDSYGPSLFGFSLFGTGDLHTTYTPAEDALHMQAAERVKATGDPSGMAGAPLKSVAISTKDPVMGNIVGGGKDAKTTTGIIGYRQSDGTVTDAKGKVIAGVGGPSSKGTTVNSLAGLSFGNTSIASGQGNAGGSGIGGLTGHDTTAIGASGQLGHI